MDAQKRAKGREHIALTINILWQVWKARNGVQFNRKKRCPGQIVNKAMQEWLEYKNASIEVGISQETGEGTAMVGSRWTPPPKGFVIMNTDVSLNMQ